MGPALKHSQLLGIIFTCNDTVSVYTNVMSIPTSSSPRLRVDPKPALKMSKSDRTRAEILDTALEFIWSRPFHEMSVNSLMASTGVGRSAFYQYFSDLHSMMEALLHILEDEISSIVQPWYVYQNMLI